MIMGVLKSVSPRTGAALGIIVLVALALRIAAASGGLWTDEAWSALFAHQATPFWGVMTEINHDNNHHINSWWSQLVGIDASPLAARMLAIITGTVSVLLAAIIGFRRSAAIGLVTAALFAVSPMMVVLGSEARGYAPMIAIVLMMIIVLERWIDDPARPAVAALTILMPFAVLSHMMILPALAALGTGTGLALWPRFGFIDAAKRTVALFVRPAIAGIITVMMIFGIAIMRAGTIRVGSYSPFDGPLFVRSLHEVFALSTGIGSIAHMSSVVPIAAAALFAGLVIAKILFRPAAPYAALYGALIFFLPILVVIMHPGNSHYARYFVVSSIGLILIMGMMIGTLVQQGAAQRFLGTAFLAAALLGSGAQLDAITANERGHGDGPVLLLKQRAPRGAAIALDTPSPFAVLKVAAAQNHYPLRIVIDACGPADYLYKERAHRSPIPTNIMRCGRAYHVIADGDALVLSGQSWAFYAQTPLPMGGPADNGPLPKR
jgi:hypothetical protein